MANDLSAFNFTKFSDKLVENLDQTNIMLQFANRDYDGDLTENSTVKIRTLGNVTMAPYTGSINYQNLTPNSEDFTVNTQEYFAFKTSDVERRQTDIDANEAYARRAAVEVSNAIERRIMAQYTKAHADNQIAGDGGAPIAITPVNVYSNFVEAGVRLNNQNVPGNDRWAVVDPRTGAAIAQSPDLIRSTSMGDQIVQGVGAAFAGNYIGMIGGFHTFWSNAAPVTTGAGAAKYLLFGQGKPINYCGQLTEAEMVRLEGSFDTAVRGLILHDATVVSENKKKIATLKAAK